MLLLFSLYFNLLLSYAAGLVPFRYNFRKRRFDTCKPFVPVATILLLLFAAVQYRLGRLPERMKIPKVGMQDIIHAVENLVLNGNCVLIAVQQLLFLETYRQLLTDLLTGVRALARRTTVALGEQVQLLVQLVLLPCATYTLHVSVYITLIEWAEISIVQAVLFMVSLIPNIAHVNNFYALLFVQRLTLGEINDMLADLWTICIRPGANELLPPSSRLQLHLQQYQQCAGSVQKILPYYSLSVALYLLILFQELMSKVHISGESWLQFLITYRLTFNFFYQFTHFYTLSLGNPSPHILEAMGTMMILVYGMYTAQLIAECYAISEKSQKIKSTVHRLSLIPGQDRYFHATINTFLLSLNHSMLKINIAGMFTMDFELLTGMLAAISNFVVLLMQFHIDYSKSKISYWHGNNSSKPLTVRS
uniref:Gustatory receptor n=1 Tax=Anopheles coluzzii TaxID=1518534 RepID=A0A6E8V2F7_ANOCL